MHHSSKSCCYHFFLGASILFPAILTPFSRFPPSLYFFVFEMKEKAYKESIIMQCLQSPNLEVVLKEKKRGMKWQKVVDHVG